MLKKQENSYVTISDTYKIWHGNTRPVGNKGSSIYENNLYFLVRIYILFLDFHSDHERSELIVSQRTDGFLWTVTCFWLPVAGRFQIRMAHGPDRPPGAKSPITINDLPQTPTLLFSFRIDRQFWDFYSGIRWVVEVGITVTGKTPANSK